MRGATPRGRDLPAGEEPDLPPGFTAARWKTGFDPHRGRAPCATRIGPAVFSWGARTYVMGIVNITPDSFSGDGLLGTGAEAAAGTGAPRPNAGAPAMRASETVARAVAQARRMADEGADLLDVGGESTRPGHLPVDEATELARVVPVVQAIRDALPTVPISIDTTKQKVAEVALDHGADLLNDVWGTGPSDRLVRLAGERGVPIVLMHNRTEPVYKHLVPEVVDDLRRAVDRALAAGVRPEHVIVDPGIGFGKTAEHNLELLHHLAAVVALGRPVLLGTSRKSTIGKVLDLPVEDRVEGTLATTALGIAVGVDIVRVHDVRANVRAALMSDAIVRR